MKVAVVGCNRGIGLELVRKLVAEGNDVYGFCRKSSAELDQLIAGKVIENFEVTAPSSMEIGLNSLGADNKKWDWLIHVAGILQNDRLETVKQEHVVKQFQVNSLAPLMCVKAFEPFLNNPSKIGLITSRMGSVADNSSGSMYGYRMSKAALNMVGKSLSVDLKNKGASVFLLHPGFVKTDMTAHNGNINPAESAAGLINILKKKGPQHSGSFWHVNGEELPW